MPNPVQGSTITPLFTPNAAQALRQAARQAAGQPVALPHLFAALAEPEFPPLPPTPMRFSAAVAQVVEDARTRARSEGAEEVSREHLVAAIDAALEAQGFVPNRLRFALYLAPREQVLAR